MIKTFKSYKIYYLIALLAIVSMVLALVSMSSSEVKPYQLESAQGLEQAYYPSTLAYVNKCGRIHVFKDVEKITYQIPDGYTGTVDGSETIVPMYGYMSKEHMPLEKVGFYSPKTADRGWSEPYILSTMWHFQLVVIWYDEKKASKSDLAALEDLANKFKGRVLVLPWLKYGIQNTLPAGRTFAFARIGASQSCSQLNFDVILEFLQFLNKNKVGTSLGQPHIAVLNSKGELPAPYSIADSLKKN
jgi:hypothetical protein